MCIDTHCPAVWQHPIPPQPRASTTTSAGAPQQGAAEEAVKCYCTVRAIAPSLCQVIRSPTCAWVCQLRHTSNELAVGPAVCCTQHCQSVNVYSSQPCTPLRPVAPLARCSSQPSHPTIQPHCWRMQLMPFADMLLQCALVSQQECAPVVAPACCAPAKEPRQQARVRAPHTHVQRSTHITCRHAATQMHADKPTPTHTTKHTHHSNTCNTSTQTC